MKIAFDEYAFCMQKYGGISRYFSRLADELFLLEQNIKIFTPLHRNHYLNQLSPQMIKGFGINDYPPKTTRVIMNLNRRWNKATIGLWNPDIIHETYFSRTGIGNRKTPIVITVFDMIHELFAKEFSCNDKTTEIKKTAVMRADHIICISENTKKDLISILKIPEQKISVIYLGVDSAVIKPEKVTPSPQLEHPFLLYVGSRNHYKNFGGFLNAVASSPLLKRDFNIISFGGGPFSPDENRMITKAGFAPGQVIQRSGTDGVLSQLYQTASAFVYPSRYEGFVLPPLEAMALNCPVASSNSSCLPEIIGDAAETFDPMNEESIAHAIAKIVYSETNRAELIRRGQECILRFPWKKCAAETLSIYRSLTSTR